MLIIGADMTIASILQNATKTQAYLEKVFGLAPDISKALLLSTVDYKKVRHESVLHKNVIRVSSCLQHNL